MRVWVVVVEGEVEEGGGEAGGEVQKVSWKD